MSLQTSYLPGVPSWVAHLGPDPDEARRFYAAVLGWEYHDIAGAGTPPFHIAALHGDPVASITGPVPEGTWIIAVNVDDLDDVRRAATRAGGTTPGESVDIATLGRFHRLHDPAGAEIHAVEPLPDRGATRRDEVGTWCTSTLLTDDPDETAPFYEGVFGWSMVGSGGCVDLGRSADEAAGSGAPGRDVVVERTTKGPARWLPGFRVGDVETALQVVRDAGGVVVVDPAVPTSTRAVIADPSGACFTIHGWAPHRGK